MARLMMGVGHGTLDGTFPPRPVTPDAIIIPGDTVVDVQDASYGPQTITAWRYQLRLVLDDSVVDTKTTADAQFTSVDPDDYYITMRVTTSLGMVFEEDLPEFAVVGVAEQIATPTVSAAAAVGLTVPLTLSAVADESVVEERHLHYQNGGAPDASDPFILLVPSATSYDFIADATGTWHFRLVDIAVPGLALDSELSVDESEVIADTEDPPNAVTLATPTASAWNRVPLVWVNGVNPAQHAVHRSTTSPVTEDATTLLVSEIAVGTLGYTDTSTVADTTYYYKIRDVNSAGAAYSNEVSVLTPSQGAWPSNDPSDGTWTTILDADGSDKYFGNSASSPGSYNFSQRWQDDTKVVVVSDAEAPDGQAIEHRTVTGDTSGWHGFANRGFGTQSEFYIQYIYRLSDNWDYHSGGDKLIMLNLQGGGRTGAFYIGMTAGGRLFFRCQKGGGIHEGVFEAIDPAFTMRPGAYHSVEWHFKAQSASGVADGQVKMWFDGVEITAWNMVAHPGDFVDGSPLDNMLFVDDGLSTKVNAWQMPEFWGGQNDTKTVDDYIRYGRIIAKAKA
jgi:hypothetical protein